MDPTTVARPPLVHGIMVERYKNDEKHYKLYTSFTPNLNTKAVTGKFYSAHNQVNTAESNVEYVNMISKKESARPRDKWREPALESHRYGWYTEPLIDLDKNDPRLFHSKRVCDITRYGALLAKYNQMFK